MAVLTDSDAPISISSGARILSLARPFARLHIVCRDRYGHPYAGWNESADISISGADGLQKAPLCSYGILFLSRIAT